MGTRLCKRLEAANHNFLIVDKNPSHFFASNTIIADIRDYEMLWDAIPACDVLIHLAAEHRDDVRPKSLYDEVNVQGTQNVCKVAAEKGIAQIIFTSSVAVYGFAKPGTGEDGEIKPFNDYGKTKFEAEEILRSWREEGSGERSLTILRPTVIFGERNRGNVYNLFRQIASGKFVMVGKGENRKSMAYVENVAACLEQRLDAKAGEYGLYNFVDEPNLSMNELVMTVKKAMGKSVAVGPRLPFWLGLSLAKILDAIATLTGKRFPISSIRVRKFCAESTYATRLTKTSYRPVEKLDKAIASTIAYEFLENHEEEPVYVSE